MALRSSLQLVWRSDRQSMTIIALSQMLTAAAALVSLLGLRELIDRIDAGNTSSSALLWPAALLIGASTLTAVLGIVITEVRLVANSAVERETTMRVLSAASRAPYADFEDPTFHDLLRRASDRASSRAWGAVWASITLVTSLATGAAISVALALIAPLVFAVAVAAALPGFLIARRNSRLLYEVNHWQTSEDRRRLALERMLRERRFVAEVRTLQAEAHLLRRIDNLFADRIGRTRRVSKRRISASSLSAVVSAVIAALALLVLINRIASGGLSLADGLVALVALQQVAGRARSVAAALSDLDEAGLYLADFEAFLAAAATRDGDLGQQLPAGRIRLRGVAFAYPGATGNAISAVDLDIAAGEFVALVGENGSGKTTLAKLVSGLYVQSAGEIEWGGKNHTPADRLASTRAVFQDLAHFPLTLRENIDLGIEPAPNDAQFHRLIESAGLEVVVEGLSNGADTMLAREFAKGADLSGGEWQRVAIARALAADSPLLIMDEPSSALDPRQERDLVDRLRSACHGRTVLFISHRFSTVRHADRIVVLADGRVVEDGDHDGLMAENGLYSELFSIQAERYT